MPPRNLGEMEQRIVEFDARIQSAERRIEAALSGGAFSIGDTTVTKRDEHGRVESTRSESRRMIDPSRVVIERREFDALVKDLREMTLALSATLNGFKALASRIDMADAQNRQTFTTLREVALALGITIEVGASR